MSPSTKVVAAVVAAAALAIGVKLYVDDAVESRVADGSRTQIVATTQGDRGVYTLFRTTITKDAGRAMIATFDSENGDRYNLENCEVDRDFHNAQKGIATRYWCEPGRAKK